MTARAAIAALLLALAAVSPSGAASSAQTISFRIASAPKNLGSSSACRDGLTKTRVLSASGKRLGTSTLCVLRASKTDRPGYAIGSVTMDSLETDALRGGTIVSRATHVFRWIARDGSLSRVTIRGQIVRGTGRYAGARGTIAGSGLQRLGRWQVAVSLWLR